MPVVMNNLFKLSGGIFWKIHLMEISILMAILSPVAFYIGAAFPMLITQVTPLQKTTSKTVGLSYSINTLGSIFGSIITGFILIPALGPFNIIWIALILHSTGIILVSQNPVLSKIKNNIIIICFAVFFLLYNTFSFSLYDIVSGPYSGIYQSSGTYIPLSLQHNGKFLSNLDRIRNSEKQDFNVIFNKHGVMSTVTVFKASNLLLTINGKPDASAGNFTTTDMPTQTFLGLLPVLFSNKTDKGLVIGYGSGVSTGILCKYVKTVDCLEIEKTVIEASKYFSEYNLNAVNSSNLNIILGDARKYIRTCRSKYDLISAEPSNIWVSGVAHLFTREFFRDCHGLLNNGGVMVQWLHIYKLSLEDFKTAIKTFSSVFPDFEIWGTFNIGDVFLVGYKNNKTRLNRIKFDEVINNYYYKKEMQEIQAGTFEEFNNYKITDALKLTPLLTGVPIHTDDRPILEYSAIKNMFILRSREIYNFLGE